MIQIEVQIIDKGETIPRARFDSPQEAIDYINAIYASGDEKENDTSSEKASDLQADGVKIEE